MRAVLVQVGPPWLEQILHGHRYSRMETDFPVDAQIIYALWKQDTNTITLTVTSASFDDIPEGQNLPVWNPTVTLHMDETAILLDIVHKSMAEND